MMEETNSRIPMAVVVEDDEQQRSLIATLLEETDMRVFECESAEAAVCLLDRLGDQIRLLLTDVELAGVMDGVVLAEHAKRRFPEMNVVVVSGRPRPTKLRADTKFMLKPWRSLDVLREAERSVR
jgi:DNA-binding NtrC family response regulator